MIKTNDLKVFATVAALGSVSGAAKALHCVQSNVTSRIRHLEADLGTTLFYRKARGMTLTPGGKVLQGYAEKVLRLLGEAEKAIKDSGENGGAIHIGSLETTAAVRLPPALAAYHRRFPEVDITLSPGTTKELVEGVLSYRLDGAFVGGTVRHADLTCEPIFDEELVLVTEPACRGPEALDKRVLLVFRQGCTYRTCAEQWARDSGLLPLRLMEFGTLDGMLGCVAAGMGATLLPRAVVQQRARDGALRIHQLPRQIAQVPTSFIRRRDTLMTGALARFLDVTRDPAGAIAAA